MKRVAVHRLVQFFKHNILQGRVLKYDGNCNGTYEENFV